MGLIQEVIGIQIMMRLSKITDKYHDDFENMEKLMEDEIKDTGKWFYS
jgi:hypothetical protein